MNTHAPDTPAGPDDTGSNEPPVYSVGELSGALKRVVEDAFGYVRVRGEVSGFKRAASGHLYMVLKDADANMDAVCWRGTAGKLEIEPEDGMEVIATGRITTYAARSKYQLVIERLEIAGEGALLKMIEERRKLERELAEAKKALALGGGGAKAEAADENVGGVTFSGQVLEGLDPKELRGLLDQAKQRIGSGVAVIVAVNDGRASIAAAVTEDLAGKVSAVDLVRAGVEALGGKGGGGRPDMAQGGGPDGSKAADALAAAKAVLAG